MAKKQRKSLAELTTNKPEPVDPAPATGKKGESPCPTRYSASLKGVCNDGKVLRNTACPFTSPKSSASGLKDMAFEAEQTVTDYIVSQLGL